MRSTPEIDARIGLEKLATYPFHIADLGRRDRLPGQRRGQRDDRPAPASQRPSTRRPA